MSLSLPLSLPLSSRHTDYKVASPALRAVGNIVTGDDIQTQVSRLSHTGEPSGTHRITASPAGRDSRRLYWKPQEESVHLALVHPDTYIPSWEGGHFNLQPYDLDLNSLPLS